MTTDRPEWCVTRVTHYTWEQKTLGRTGSRQFAETVAALRNMLAWATLRRPTRSYHAWERPATANLAAAPPTTVPLPGARARDAIWLPYPAPAARGRATPADRRLSVGPDALIDLIRDLYDGEPCQHDHHGYCQTHGWTATEPRCPHARANDLLEKVDHET